MVKPDRSLPLALANNRKLRATEGKVAIGKGMESILSLLSLYAEEGTTGVEGVMQQQLHMSRSAVHVARTTETRTTVVRAHKTNSTKAEQWTKKEVAVQSPSQ